MFTSVQPVKKAEYIDVKNAVGHLLIVRPLRYQKEGFITEFWPQGTDVVFCDVADLDEVDPDTGMPGRIYRGNTFLQGNLKGTFKRYLEQTLLGMLYKGPKKGGGQAPYLWQDLSGDPACQARGAQWLAANSHFLAQITLTQPAVVSGPPSYSPPQAAPQPSQQQVVGGNVSTLESMRLLAAQRGNSEDGIPF